MSIYFECTRRYEWQRRNNLENLYAFLGFVFLNSNTNIGIKLDCVKCRKTMELFGTEDMKHEDELGTSFRHYYRCKECGTEISLETSNAVEETNQTDYEPKLNLSFSYHSESKLKNKELIALYFLLLNSF